MTALHITRRERTILEAAANGATIEETADQLGISVQTVKNARYKLMRKADAASFIDVYRVLGWLKIPGRATTTQAWHCKHGLDLRIHERCYLCEPLSRSLTFSSGGAFRLEHIS